MRVPVRMRFADVDEGVQSDCECCPLALATQRALPGRSVSVLGNSVLIDGVSLPLPLEASEFADRFDLGQPVLPIDFELDLSLFEGGAA